MGVSVRIEALNYLDGLVDKKGEIPFSKLAAKKAEGRLASAREEYERARLEALIYDYPRHHRTAIFGTSKLLADNDPEFVFIRDLSKALVEEIGDTNIITGGGPGIMRAGNLGVYLAREAQTKDSLKARSIGITLTSLPHQEEPNMHLDMQHPHRDFPTRIQDFLDKSKASYLGQGGIGTIYEKFALVQTLQVGHFESNYPIIAHPYWEPVLEAFYKVALLDREEGQSPLITPRDMGLVKISGKIPDIVDIVAKNYNWWNENYRQGVYIKP
jgi:predicted Rossmann-fold nucleotide-binding protein